MYGILFIKKGKIINSEYYTELLYNEFQVDVNDSFNENFRSASEKKNLAEMMR